MRMAYMSPKPRRVDLPGADRYDPGDVMHPEGPDDKSVAIVFNPASGMGAGREALRDLTGRLQALGISYDVTETTGAGDGAAAARATNPRDCRAILVIGGDGTVNDVMNGPVPRGVPVGLMAFGTSNVLATALGFSREPADVVAALRRGRTRSIDLIDRDGRRCAAVAGVGFDAYIVMALARNRSGNITKLNYAIPILRGMARYRFPPLRIQVDGRRVAERAGFVIIGNVWNYAGMMRVVPRARPDDGLLDICVFRGRTRWDLCRYAAAVPFGIHLAFPDVCYLRGKEVTVEATDDSEVLVELDGDPGGKLPAHFRILPGEATLLDA